MSTLTLDSYKKISVDHYTDCHADTIITDSVRIVKVI